MVARQAGPLWTVEDYLCMERCSTVKHEYHGGLVYAMAGGTQKHSVIALNVGAFLRPVVRGTGCHVYNSDIKVRQSPEDYVYPDVVVTCDARDNVPDQDWIDEPALVVEVLSPSTEQHDRGDKFDGYKGIATLREYVLIDYQQRQVQVWRREDAGNWTSRTYTSDEAVALASLDVVLPMDVIYEDSGV